MSETMCNVLEVIWSLFTLASIAKTRNKERNLPCGKPAREKAFELHTVSEIILDVVLNMIWHFITAAFS